VALLLPVATVIVCAVIWFAAIHITQTHRNGVMASALRENANRAIAYDHFVTGVFDRANVAARHLANTHSDIAAPPSEAPPRALIDSAATDPLFASVEIADAQGRVLWSNAPTPTARSIAGDAAFRLLHGSASPAPILTDPALDRNAGIAVIDFSRAIRRPDGSFGGAVVIGIPVDRLTQFYEGADFRPHDLISVIRLDGLTLARREGSVVSHGQNLAGRLVMQRQAAEPNGTYVGPSSIDGIERIFSQRRLPQYGVFVSVGLGVDDVLAPSYARRRVFYLTVAALTLTLLLAALAFWLGVRGREDIIRQLAATNDRLCEAQTIGRIGDWELDLGSNLLLCSDEICRMHGRGTADDILSANEALAYHDEASQRDIQRTIRAVITRKRPEQCEVVATMGDGRVAHLRIRMSPIVDPDGQVRTILGTEQDITSERRHERLRAEVAHITRVEAVNVMAATIAHELAQPLTAAGNYVSAASHLAEQTKTSQLDRERMAVLLSQASRQIGLTGKIISRARDMVSDRRSSEQASLDDIVEEAIALSRVADPAVARAAISVQLQSDTGHVAADKVQIQQVLLNLIRNAAQALAEVKDPQVVVSSRRAEAGMVTVSVADNGNGLSGTGDDVFAPFGAGNRNGLGIGLSICRTIVDSYGGRIWSEASPLGGAAICFTLPLDELAMLYDVA
jgi:PAS domain S-box-containing protein